MKEFLEQLLLAFSKNVENEERTDTWKWCYDNIGKEKIDEASLEDMANNNLTWGIFGGRSGFRSDQPRWDIEAIMKLGIATGVRAITNPEGGIAPPIANMRLMTVDEILNEIEGRIGFKIDLPQFIGGCKLWPTSRGIITDRHCHYLWVMKRIIELYPDRNTRIVEVGSGLGLLGYYLDRAGYKDYTSIDLAYANLLQSYFLARNLPEREFVISGSIKDPFSPEYKDCLKILHCSDFAGVPQGRYDLMVNMDGLTEMGIEIARNYIGSNCADKLLSINHEAGQYRVIDICPISKILKYRYPFWIRDGYVEELYESI